jgi:hypothetical protein
MTVATTLEVLAAALAFALGATVVGATTLSAVETIVVPRAFQTRLTRWVFRAVFLLFRVRGKRATTYEERDRAMALYGPVSLLVLAVSWLVSVGLGYTSMFWALGARPVRLAFTLSGSSLFTLGFAAPHDLPATALAFSEATFGIGLLALLISYLPSIYASFSRREAAVAALDVRAGSSPSALELLLRHHRIEGLDRLTEVWQVWEAWFTDIEETHTSIPAIVFFRSPDPRRSWVTAAGAVLDGAAITAAGLVPSSGPQQSEAQLCIRAGFIALRKIADFFGLPHDPDPHWPDQPISVHRFEFDEVYDRLVEEGLPMKPDREQAWRDFAGWRVNYDTVLLSLASLTMAPPARWSSDRSILRRPAAGRRRARAGR